MKKREISYRKIIMEKNRKVYLFGIIVFNILTLIFMFAFGFYFQDDINFSIIFLGGSISTQLISYYILHGLLTK